MINHVGNNNGLEAYVQMVVGWMQDRNLIEGSDNKSQFLKLIQECGELSDDICKGNDIHDELGDVLVVLIGIAEREGISVKDCLQVAFTKIKDRKGTMRDGVFIKEE